MSTEICSGIEPGRHDADGIGDIGDAMIQKVSGLMQGRDRDPAKIALKGQARHVGRLRRLHVRSQLYAEAAHALGHDAGVSGEHFPLQDQRRGRQILKSHV